MIGASGSGKTQTLKGIFYALQTLYIGAQKILIDFHGDQDIAGETVYPLHMASPYGINPLTINLDPEGGGPNLQAISVAAVLKKSLYMGANQEGLLLEVLETCYRQRGIVQEVQATWNREGAAHLCGCRAGTDDAIGGGLQGIEKAAVETGGDLSVWGIQLIAVSPDRSVDSSRSVQTPASNSSDRGRSLRTAHLYSPSPVDHIRVFTTSNVVGWGNNRGSWVSSGERDSHHDRSDR